MKTPHWAEPLFIKVRTLASRARASQHLEDELEFHLDQQTAENIATGMPAKDARSAAVRAFGNVTLLKEEARESWGWSWLDRRSQDLRYAVRQLQRAPGFAVITVLTLALGIGAATTVFSVAESILWKPLSFSDPNRLVAIWARSVTNTWQQGLVSAPDFFDWQANNQAFSEMAAYGWGENRTVTGGAETARGSVDLVTTNFFSTLGVEEMGGRDFLPGESERGRNQVAVVSAQFWERQFPGVPAAAGQVVRLDDVPYTIIGVLPRDFHLADFALHDILTTIPQDSDMMRQRDARTLEVIGRLKEGVSIAQGQANLDTLCRQLSLTYPATNGKWGVRVQSLRDSMVSPSYRTTLILFVGASVLLLLTACANAAGLLLARTLNRREEFAVRAALGAGRWRLIGQLLAESALLGGMGGVLGIALARWGVQVFVLLASSSSVEVPRLAEISLDVRALGFAAAISLLVAAVTGFAPAVASSKPDLNGALRSTSRTGTSDSRNQRLRSLFVTAQFSLATVLLVAAGLFIHSLARLQHLDPGFDPRSVLSGYVSLSGVRYADPQRMILFYQQLAERTGRTPEAMGFAVASHLPLTEASDLRFQVEDRPALQPGDEPSVLYSSVSPGYFDALRVPLLRGRLFTDEDKAQSSRVVIVNENFARQNFPGADPVGRHLTILGPAVPGQPKLGVVQIVGMTANVHAVGLDEVPFAEMYFPYLQEPVRDVYVALRMASGASANEALLRSAVSAIDKDAPVSEIKTMNARISESLGENRFNMILIGTTALMAMLLAALGTYGIIAFYVTQRTREIGIRMALGADRGNVVRMVLQQSAKLAAIGVAVGVAAALVLGEFLRSALYLVPHVHNGLLYGVTPRDPLTFLAVVTVLGSSAVVACYAPALRATRVEPIVALRHE